MMMMINIDEHSSNYKYYIDNEWRKCCSDANA